MDDLGAISGRPRAVHRRPGWKTRLSVDNQVASPAHRSPIRERPQRGNPTRNTIRIGVRTVDLGKRCENNTGCCAHVRVVHRRAVGPVVAIRPPRCLNDGKRSEPCPWTMVESDSLLSLVLFCWKAPREDKICSTNLSPWWKPRHLNSWWVVPTQSTHAR